MNSNFFRLLTQSARILTLSLVSCLAITGCSSMNSLPPSAAGHATVGPGTNSLVLHAGDSVRVTFPGAPSMDTATEIRLDGKITLPMIGEVQATGLTPAELEKEILDIAGPQLVVKQVSVSVVSSAFEVYMEGAVMRPGKLVADRVLTPLEALSDAGIDFQRANLKAVHIIRKSKTGQTINYKLNVRDAFYGRPSEVFDLKPYDIIYVPERFSWY